MGDDDILGIPDENGERPVIKKGGKRGTKKEKKGKKITKVKAEASPSGNGHSLYGDDDDSVKDEDFDVTGLFEDDGIEDDFDALRELMNSEDIELKTDLSDELIINLARAKVVAKEFQIPVLNEFCDHIMKMRVSRGRQGRSEIVNAIGGRHGNDDTELTGFESFVAKLRGGQ